MENHIVLFAWLCCFNNTFTDLVSECDRLGQWWVYPRQSDLVADIVIASSELTDEDKRAVLTTIQERLNDVR